MRYRPRRASSFSLGRLRGLREDTKLKRHRKFWKGRYEFIFKHFVLKGLQTAG